MWMVTAAIKLKDACLLGSIVITNLDSVLKSKDITLPTKVQIVKAMVFPVVVCGRESCTIKKVKHWRIDAFELWCWRRLESPLDSEIKLLNPKGNKLWTFFGRTYAESFSHLRWRANSPETTLMLGKIEGKRREQQRMMRWLLTQWT